MRRRPSPVTDEVPPERLWRFRVADWLDLVDESAACPPYTAWLTYRREREAWMAAHGVSASEFRRRIPPQVVVP